MWLLYCFVGLSFSFMFGCKKYDGLVVSMMYMLVISVEVIWCFLLVICMLW